MLTLDEDEPRTLRSIIFNREITIIFLPQFSLFSFTQNGAFASSDIWVTVEYYLTFM